MKLLKRLFIVVFLMGVLASVAGLWLLYGSQTSNPRNYKTVGDIPTPLGYERVTGEDEAYTHFLRSLHLKSRGTKVQYFTGGNARLQLLCYAVVDMPLLSNAEQCADVCMRLRAEYLFQRGQFGSIHFRDVNGNTMRYSGGNSRNAFESYLRRVYGVASTFSLSRELKQRQIAQVQPGDVFVYAAVDRPGNQKYGHAVMVVDVAVNKFTGRRAVLLAEGNTPARDIHVIRNLLNPLRSPWIVLDEDAKSFQLSVFRYKADELKHFQ